MANHGEEDTSGLGDIGKFVSAMGSRYRRVPELKRLGRLLGKWLIGGVIVVLVCVVGEVKGVGFQKAAEIYWRWWVYPPFVIALVPIGFTLLLAAIQVAWYTITFPFVMLAELTGSTALLKQAGNGLVILGFAFFIAWAAHDDAKRAVEPKSAPNAHAAAHAVPPAAASASLPAAATSTSGSRLNWWTIVVGVLSFCGGIAKTTFSSVTSNLAQRLVDDRKRVVLYGPDDRPK